jgi:Sulfotransferase domain
MEFRVFWLDSQPILVDSEERAMTDQKATIKVIGAGLGRTGTLSLKAALEELGFSRCYHMTDVFAHRDHAKVWDDAAHGQPVDWETLFQGYQATVDWPGCAFYEEFMQRYPDAKVILSVRNPERWYESARQTIFYARNAFPGWMSFVVPRMRRFTRMIDRLVWKGLFEGRFEDKAYAINVFNRHNEQVQRVVPVDRLLVYEVQQGWEPLCNFLGVPVPADKKFPHLNDTVEFRARIQKVARFMRIIGYTIAVLVALMVVWLVIKLLF